MNGADGELLASFWRTAARPVPLVVVGGGRWARVWTSVIIGARGNGHGVSMAARSDPESAIAWAETLPGAEGLRVVPDLQDAIALTPRPVIAIVASRPRDHVRDALAAMKGGLHVLVEKPLSDRALAGLEVVSIGRQLGRIVALGTEFAFLPAFHQCARHLQISPGEAISARLEWNDPAEEVRHGAAKRRHEEVGILVDLLAHAVSIFRIFAPRSRLYLVDARASGTAGVLRIGDHLGSCFELRCNIGATARRRALTVETARHRAFVDFAHQPGSVEVDGCKPGLSPAAREFQSTLRLQLGALFMEAAGEIETSPITRDLTTIMSLQNDVEGALSEPAREP